jgi:hypothetical protein
MQWSWSIFFWVGISSGSGGPRPRPRGDGPRSLKYFVGSARLSNAQRVPDVVLAIVPGPSCPVLTAKTPPTVHQYVSKQLKQTEILRAWLQSQAKDIGGYHSCYHSEPGEMIWPAVAQARPRPQEGACKGEGLSSSRKFPLCCSYEAT